MRILFSCLAIFFLAGCSPNNVDVDNSLGKYFKDNGTEGCFALLNNNSGRFTLYNLARYRDSAFLPASSFAIVHSLVGLQTGVITNDSMVIKKDSLAQGRAACQQDLSMYQAFRLSCPSYFQELARRLGRDTLQHWLDSLSYGTKKIKGPVDSFWLNNSLKITPDEQLGLVKRLYFEQLPFFKRNQQIVKRAMRFEDKPEYRLSYYTGSGNKENGHPLGWVVGYIEENGHPYFFVLNFETANRNLDPASLHLKILKGILSELGFMKGNK